MTPHFYREGLDGETEESFVQRLTNNLEQLIEVEGPQNIAAMIAEPLMGAGGVIIPPKDYFPSIQKVLTKHNIPLIDDEVVCAFGRTGNMWGAETFDMTPSSITIAKALSAGFLPISAVIVPDTMYEPIKEASGDIGIFGHGYTYSGHPVSCRAIGDVIALCPPLVITLDEVNELFDILESSIKQSFEYL